MGKEAGQGQHEPHVIPLGNSIGVLKPDEEYVSIKASSWFVNKASSWWTDRMASGILVAEVNSETYEAALGTYELDGGSRLAPIFGLPIVPKRRYLGGPITLTASLYGCKEDQVLARLLKSAAEASLGIVAGMINTASLTGPQAVLGAAGGKLVGGVRGVLQDNAEKRESFFDPGGFTFSIGPEELQSERTYVLLHRGSELTRERLEISEKNGKGTPEHKGADLEDGAWLLLQIGRSKEFNYERPWKGLVRATTDALQSLLQDFQAQVVSKPDALAALMPSNGGNTVYDKFLMARAAIQNDGALTTTQVRAFVAGLFKKLMDTRKQIEDAQDGQPTAATLTPLRPRPDELEAMAQLLAASVAYPPRSFELLTGESSAPTEPHAVTWDMEAIQGAIDDLPSTFDLSLVASAKPLPLLRKIDQ